MVENAAVFDKIKTQNIATLFDACKIDGGSEIPCGVMYVGGDKQYRTQEIATTTDCTIRIPITENVTTESVLEVVEFRGQTVSERFKVDGVNLGIGIKILKCKRIEV